MPECMAQIDLRIWKCFSPGADTMKSCAAVCKKNGKYTELDQIVEKCTLNYGIKCFLMFLSEPACYNTEFCIASDKQQRRVLRIQHAFILDSRKSSEGNVIFLSNNVFL